MRLRRAARVAVLGLAVAAATGCSVAGTSFHPGVAARVGDTSISSRDVDRVAVATCKAYDDQLATDDQVVPLRFIKSSVVQALALQSAAEQFGADHGVTPSVEHAGDVAAARDAAGDLPDDQLDAVALLQTTSALITDVAGQVGAQIAADAAAQTTSEPVKGSVPAAGSTEAQQIGVTAFGEWIDDHDVDIDPQYGIKISAQGPEAVDTSVAYAVSAIAKAGLADEPDQDATMALPPSQRCGQHSSTGGAG